MFGQKPYAKGTSIEMGASELSIGASERVQPMLYFGAKGTIYVETHKR